MVRTQDQNRTSACREYEHKDNLNEMTNEIAEMGIALSYLPPEFEMDVSNLQETSSICLKVAELSTITEQNHPEPALNTAGPRLERC